MRRKLKKPFALMLALFILMTSVEDRGLFVSAEETEESEVIPVSEIQVEETMTEASEESMTLQVEETLTEAAEESIPLETGETLVESFAESNPSGTEEVQTKETTEETIEEMFDETGQETIEETETESETESETEEESDKEQIVTYQPVNQPQGVYVIAYAQRGVLPDGTYMVVSEVSEGTAAYSEAEQALANNNVAFDGFKALDITFYNAQGQVIEPEDGSVQVHMTLDAQVLPKDTDPDTVAVQHHDTSSGSVQIETVADANVGTVAVNDVSIDTAFSVDSFSTFTITWKASGMSQYQRSLTVSCEDESGISIGTDKSVEISTSSIVQDIAPSFDGYVFVKAMAGNTEIHRIGIEQGKWKYSTQSSGDDWTSLNDKKVRFIYRSSAPYVKLAQSISGDTVYLKASTYQFSNTPTLSWTVSKGSEYVVFDDVNHTLTWLESAPDSATVTVTVTATNTSTNPAESATAQIELSNQKYTITYDSNTEQEADKGTYIDTKTYRLGETATILGNDTTKFSNKTYPVFVGWSTSTKISNMGQSSSAARDVYTPGQKITMTGDLHLYGMWAEDGARVDHVDIRVNGVTFMREIQIVDGKGEIINTSTQTFTGKVTKVSECTVMVSDDKGGEKQHAHFNDVKQNEEYEFRAGNFSRIALSKVTKVTVKVDITGDDGTVLKDQEITFTKDQIYAAYANCDGGREQKGMDFDVTGESILLEPQRVPAKLIVTKDFIKSDGTALTANEVSKLTDFQITVTNTGSTLNETLKVDGAVEKTVMAGGQEVKIYMSVESDGTYMWALTGIPSDTYTVTESGGERAGALRLNAYEVRYGDYEGTTNMSASKTASVTIETDQVKLTAFKNSYGTLNDLSITKNISVENNETVDVSDIAYTFEVKSENVLLNGSYTVHYTDGSESNSVNFNNGKAKITIMGTGTAVIKDLPTGTYTVTEKGSSKEPTGFYFDDSTTVSQEADVTESAVATVTITNKYLQERTLVVTKTVGGSMGSEKQAFVFGIKVNGQEISGQYGNITIDNGKFTLAHGQKLEVTGLRRGDQVEITEEDYSTDGYVTTVNGASELTYRTGSDGLTSVTTNVDYQNIKEMQPPTGIVENKMPFFMMTAGAGIAVMILFVMYWRRRRF